MHKRIAALFAALCVFALTAFSVGAADEEPPAHTPGRVRAARA